MIVNWTESALEDLQAIEAYISRNSAKYGRIVVERVLAQTALLAKFPELGSIVAEYEDQFLRELFQRPYRIVYRIRSNRVDIAAVVHAARRLPEGL